MSRIIVCHQIEKRSKIKVFDVTDTERGVEVILFEFNSQDDIVHLHVDYLGNIYLKHNIKREESKSSEDAIYYIVTPDAYSESGIELTPIKKPSVFRENLLESSFLKEAVKTGVIKANKLTLRGKTQQTLNEMTTDEKEEHLDANEFADFDDTFKENKFYWVQYNDDDKPVDDEMNDSFYINGAVTDGDTKTIGIVYSDLLTLTPGTFDTILIHGEDGSKNVVSTVERVDGYCPMRLTVYTSGVMRVNFIDRIRDSRLCIDPVTKTLVAKKISN